MTQELFDAMKQSVIDGDEETGGGTGAAGAGAGHRPAGGHQPGLCARRQLRGRAVRRGRDVPARPGDGGRGDEGRRGRARAGDAAARPQRQMLGKVVLGTVKGDIHEIGKTLVATMLTASGFEVFDLGVDVPFEKFAEKAREVERRHRRRLGVAHHDDDGSEDRHRGAGRPGPAPQGQGDGGRRAGHAQLGRRNRRGRLQRRCDRRGDAGQETCDA